MELSRRDALVALSAAGVGSLAGCGAPEATTDGEPADRPEESALDTLVAVAEVVYPEAATDPEAFVRTYVAGRTADRPAYRSSVVAAAQELTDVARDWQDAPFVELDPVVRDRLLRDLGVDTADPDPEGAVPERLRHFVVNELLFAFYASPAGAELVGLENPPGHPGGTRSYQRPPPERFRTDGEATPTGTEPTTPTDAGGDDG